MNYIPRKALSHFPEEPARLSNCFYFITFLDVNSMAQGVSVPSKSIGLKRTPHPHDQQNVGVRGANSKSSA
jgi:hypothetical protein